MRLISNSTFGTRVDIILDWNVQEPTAKVKVNHSQREQANGGPSEVNTERKGATDVHECEHVASSLELSWQSLAGMFVC